MPTTTAPIYVPYLPDHPCGTAALWAGRVREHQPAPRVLPAQGDGGCLPSRYLPCRLAYDTRGQGGGPEACMEGGLQQEHQANENPLGCWLK